MIGFSSIIDSDVNFFCRYKRHLRILIRDNISNQGGGIRQEKVEVAKIQ